MTKTNFSGIAFAVLIMVVLSPIRSWAQDDVNSYKVGERVEYNDNPYKPVWYEGTVVRLYPPSNQVVIHWDPRADSPTYTRNGVSIYEAAYTLDRVRHIKARTSDKPKNPVRDPDPDPKNDKSVKAGNPPASAGQGLITKAEILAYLNANAYVNGQPKDDPQMCKNLIEQIKLRGAKEQFVTMTAEIRPLINSRCWYQSNDTNVFESIEYNLGLPLTVGDLIGNWNMYTFGATVDTVHADGNLYRQNEYIAGKYGFITVRANGTYVWKVGPSDPPANYAKGTWRNATREEMGIRGGAGVVLQKAADGKDWIVYKYLDIVYMPGGIDVRELPSQTGGSRRRGWKG